MVRGQSVYFTVYNRGKKSVCLDLRSEGGKEVFAALVGKADIVLENFRPGVMRAMGFDYERLRALNPGIILVSVSGFGQYGPYSDRPAFDSLGQAMSGLMTLTGQAEGKPVGTASSVVDRYTRCTRPSARWPRSATASAPARARSSTCACSTRRSPWSRSRRRTTWPRRRGRRGRAAALPRRGRLGRHQRGGARDGGAAHEDRRREARARPTTRRWRAAAAADHRRADGRGVVRRAHHGGDLRRAARGGRAGGAGADDPRGGEGSAPVGARDAGEDGRPRGRRDVRARASRSSCRRRRAASAPCPRPASTPTRCCATCSGSTARRSTRSAATADRSR